MRNYQRWTLLFFIFLCIKGYTGCKKPDIFSEIPVIEYKDFSINDTIFTDELGNEIIKGTLIFSFQDGDGDIGSDPGLLDSNSTDNLFIYRYKYINDEIQKDSVPILFQIPYVPEPDGQNRTLKGEIEVEMDFYMNLLPTDTLQLEFYLFDRAKNQSNTEITPLIVMD